METTKILVDIESLFDTRLGRLRILLGEEKTAEYISTEEYNFRRSDDFSKLVNMEKYNSIPKNLELIKHSVISYVIKLVKNKVINLDLRNAYLQKPYAYEIILNTQDFQLTPDEIELISKALFSKLKLNSLIATVSLSEKNLTPSFLKNSDFAYVFIYNFREWLNEHLISFEHIKLENTIFYFPAIYHNDLNLIDKEEEKLRKLGFNDSFNFLEFAVCEKLKINFLPIVFYNNVIISEAYLDKYNKYFKEKQLSEVLEDGSSSPTV